MNWRVILTGVVALLGSTAGTKVINLAVIAVATRELGLEAVGLVFFVEAAASIGLGSLDLGFYEVLVRRAARGQATRSTMARAMSFRGAVLAVACGVVAAIATVMRPDHAAVMTGLFAVFGVFYLHEIGRAILAGKELFGRNAIIALVSRAVGGALAVGGMLAGHGIEAWLVGMALSELVQLVWVSAVAWLALPKRLDEPERPLSVEGLSFWALALLKVSVNHGSMLIVGGSLGFVSNGILGVATKAVQGALLGVTGLTYAAYPTLAREKRKVIQPRHAAAVVGIALVVASMVFVGAPILAELLGEGHAAETTEVIRLLTVAAFILALAQPLDTWIRAKDGERGLVIVALIEGLIMLGGMAILVDLDGLRGAVEAVSLGAIVRLIGTLTLARAQLKSAPRQSSEPERGNHTE